MTHCAPFTSCSERTLLPSGTCCRTIRSQGMEACDQAHTATVLRSNELQEIAFFQGLDICSEVNLAYPATVLKSPIQRWRENEFRRLIFLNKSAKNKSTLEGEKNKDGVFFFVLILYVKLCKGTWNAGETTVLFHSCMTLTLFYPCSLFKFKVEIDDIYLGFRCGGARTRRGNLKNSL